MKIKLAILWVLTALHGEPVDAQSIEAASSSNEECIQLNHDARSLVESGRAIEAERILSAALTRGDRHGLGCAGLLTNNMAAVLLVSGRLDEAEVFAGQSLSTLEQNYPPDDPSLLRPLQILAAVYFEQGKAARAREALRKMQLLRLDRIEDRALVDGVAATMCEAAGKWREAESHYSDAIRALQQAGRGEAADTGALLNGIGALYIKQHRLTDARLALDRALAIFASAQDAVPWDRVKLLYTSGVLRTLEQQWQRGEREFAEALSLADQQPQVESPVLLHLLIDYAQVLRRNHRRREAQALQARIAVLQGAREHSGVVDVTDLLSKAKGRR